MRTDYKSVCVHCRLRFERSRRQCPACGGTDLCAAIETKRWAQDLPPQMRLPHYFGIVHFFFGAPRIGALTGRLELWAEAPPTWGTPTTGRIVGVEAVLEAPLAATRCVGYRLSGRVAGHAVDDADLSPFDIETADGERIHVVPEPAALDIELGEELHLDAAAMKRASPFLALRGLSGDSMQLAESALHVGDEVTIWGDLEGETSKDEGYRGSAAVRVLRAGIGSPMVIRPTTSARSDRTSRTGTGSPRA